MSLLLSILLFNCTGKMVEKPPVYQVEDFFKNPEKTIFSLSPQGQYYAWLAPWEDMMNIHYKEVDSDEEIRLTSETGRSIYYTYWINDNTLLYMKDVGGDENFQLLMVNVESRQVDTLFAEQGIRAEVLDVLYDRQDEIIITVNKRNPQVFDPYLVNIKTGKMKMLAENPGNIISWMTDHDGVVRMGVASDGVNQQVYYREGEDEEFREIMNLSFKETFTPYFFSFDNKNIYALSDLGRDRQAAVIFDPRKVEEIEILYEHPDVDISSLHYSKKRKLLTTLTYFTDKKNRYFFDDQVKQIVEKVEKKFPGYESGLHEPTRDESKYIVSISSDRLRTAYYLYDAESEEFTHIHTVAPWLKEEHMAEMRPVQYSSRDGLTIHGYLTLPPGEKPENLPVIVNPHGGPWARDYWGFIPEVQMLANRGYGVFQMNFRGSLGYGKDFWQSSFKQWGRTMQDDISDGVKWLIEEGIADPDRVAIYGASYGGYATLAGMTLTPELYCCGVDYVGVSNMFTFMNTIPPYWEPLLDMFHEMVGDPVEDSLMLAEVSPVNLVGNIQAPIFVAQGANDPRVNKDESDQIVEALKARGIEVEYMVKEDEGHGFYNEQNQFDFYNAMIEFLDKHMK